MIRPLLFELFRDPEQAHEKALELLQWVGKHPRIARLIHRFTATNDRGLEQTIWGQKYHHPVGLAAGFDKNGVALGGLPALDLAFAEEGTVLPREQAGNPRPRIFRFPRDQALINRMGFNSLGAPRVKKNLMEWGDIGIPVWLSMGKNKDTPQERAAEDYDAVLHELHDLIHVLTVNVSSPNTPGLRALQDKEPLRILLRILQESLMTTFSFGK